MGKICPRNNIFHRPEGRTLFGEGPGHARRKLGKVGRSKGGGGRSFPLKCGGKSQKFITGREGTAIRVETERGKGGKDCRESVVLNLRNGNKELR